MAKPPALIEALRQVSPGTGLREGLDRVLQARMGALILLGDSSEVLSICSGGFLVDAEYSPQKLFELAKMDGAIVLSADGSRIARANVHLVPDAMVPTSETGTRHRTAERVARSVDVSVFAVSEELSVITVYRQGYKSVIAPTPVLLSRANQGLATLERYRDRLSTVMSTLDLLEIRNQVTYRDVIIAIQRSEMVRRIDEEIESYLIELGDQGRLISLQLEELCYGIVSEYNNVIEDYLGPCTAGDVDKIKAYLASLETDELLDVSVVGMGLREMAPPSSPLHRYDDGTNEALQAMLGTFMEPKGFRILSKVSRMPEDVKQTVISKLGSLFPIVEAAESEIASLPGVGNHWAKAIKDLFNQYA
ncbi:MAG: DNA integrity scanning diadenylate cyclase DisA [Actinomycetota bacterium]|nr:DNA integrity scanning diadenylate cyclase DisA [Actinomycetota bacterium]